MILSWDNAVSKLALSIPAKHRWVHVWGVLETALALADHHGVDLEKTAWAALLHDCAKCLDLAVLEKNIQELGLAEEDDDWSNPQIWHALVGAFLARDKFGVRDEGILQAIRYHPTGFPEMDELGMVVFIADYTEPSRRYPGSRELRKRALERPLIETAAMICRNKIDHVREKGHGVHSRSLRAVEALERQAREKPDAGESR